VKGEILDQVLFLLPVAVFGSAVLLRLPAAVLWLLLLTGLFQVFYFAGLSPAYGRGELSVVYPLVRSFPVLLVAGVTAFLPSQAPPALLALGGMGALVVGCFVLPLRAIRDWRPSGYFDAASGYALLAAFGTAGYSLVDSEALRLMCEGFPGRPKWELSLVYLFGEAVTSAGWLLLYAAVLNRGDLLRSLREQKATASFIGGASYLTYALVLLAMHFARNVSYVVALRQTSIVISMLLGILVLGEPRHLLKLAGAGLITLGLVLVAVG
jgi:drug/metabolite transporter (DMT)-like permease